MLRKPSPGLHRLGQALYGGLVGVQHRTLQGLARLRFGEPVFEREELKDRLIRASVATLPSILEPMLVANIEVHGIDVVEEASSEALEALTAERRRMKRRATLLTGVLRAIRRSSLERALSFGDRFIDQAEHRVSLRALANMHREAGAIDRPIELFERRRQLRGRPLSAERGLPEEQRILGDGMRLAEVAPRDWSPVPNRVLYYLAQCRPHHTSGYAIRTHWLLRGLAAKNWDIAALARYGYPNDRYDFRAVSMVEPAAVVDGLCYTFHPDKVGFRELDEERYNQRAADALAEHCQTYRPALIHAASNYKVGLAAVAAARSLGLPCIYEVRGLWHMTRAAKVPAYLDSQHYRLSQALEVQAAKAADRVFAITNAIRDILIDEGVEPEKISVIPNAVNVAEFEPRPRDSALAAELGLSGATVIGFVGSFPDYEGLDLLLEAAAGIGQDLSWAILLVGDGVAYSSLKRQAKALGISDRLVMTGRVPHAEVPRYYSLVDIAVFPRRAVRVCEVVSPLKPFEAMAMGKVVLASDVAALAEIVDHERTGLLHRKDDVDSLRVELARLLESAELRDTLGRAGRAWVGENRSWAAVSALIEEAYRDLLGQGRRLA